MMRLKEVVGGAAAGFAATVPMTFYMEVVRATLPADEQDPLPPRQITERAAAKAGVASQLTQDDKRNLSAAAHFGFGASAGAVYGVLTPRSLPPVLTGIAYGLAVWATSYLGWLPALGLYRSATREPPGRNVMNIGAHVVWGAVLGLLARPGDDESPRRRQRRQ